jgi:hypothetical protein
MLTAATVLVLAGALSAGCAGRQSLAEAAGPGDSLAGAASYQQLVDTLYGTGNDRVAAEARASAAVQKSIADCMRAAGHTYTPSPSERTAGGPIVPADLTSLAPIGAGGFGIAQFKRNVAEAADNRRNPGFTGLTTDAELEAYGAALGPCITAAPDVEPFAPAAQASLSVELEKLFTALEEQQDAAAMLTGYGACMKQAGFPVANYLQLHQLIDGKFPDPATGWAKVSQDPAWAAAVDFERRAADTDATCRTGLRDHVMAAAEPQLRQFTARHAVALSEANTQWTAQRLLPSS